MAGYQFVCGGCVCVRSKVTTLSSAQLSSISSGAVAAAASGAVVIVLCAHFWNRRLDAVDTTVATPFNSYTAPPDQATPR